MHKTQTPSQPAIVGFLHTALRDRQLKATGALDALIQHAEQVLALCEEYPENEPLHQLLERVRAQIVARCGEKQVTGMRLSSYKHETPPMAP